MPPLPPVPGVLKVVLNGFIDNLDVQNWANVLHFRFSGGQPSGADCVQIGATVADMWRVNMAPECPSPTSLQNVTVTDLTSNVAGEGVFGSPEFGTRGDDSIPANAAYLVSYPSPIRYRGGHPRTYLYVLGNADLQGAGEWSTLATAEVLAHWKAFIAEVQGIVTGSTSMGSLCFVKYVDSASVPLPPHRLASPLVFNLNINVARGHAQMASQRGRIGRTPRNA